MSLLKVLSILNYVEIVDSFKHSELAANTGVENTATTVFDEAPCLNEKMPH